MFLGKLSNEKCTYIIIGWEFIFYFYQLKFLYVYIKQKKKENGTGVHKIIF